MGNDNTEDIIAEKTEKMQRRLANLKPFPKGVSGNPKGKKPGTISVVAGIKRKLEEVPDGQKTTYLELLINRIFKQAIQEGNEQMIKIIVNYVDGMPVQAVENKTEGSLEIKIVEDKPKNE